MMIGVKKILEEGSVGRWGGAYEREKGGCRVVVPLGVVVSANIVRRANLVKKRKRRLAERYWQGDILLARENRS